MSFAPFSQLSPAADTSPPRYRAGRRCRYGRPGQAATLPRHSKNATRPGPDLAFDLSPATSHSLLKAKGRERTPLSRGSQRRCPCHKEEPIREAFSVLFSTEVISRKFRVTFLATPFQTCKHRPQQNRPTGVSPSCSKSTHLQEAQN